MLCRMMYGYYSYSCPDQSREGDEQIICLYWKSKRRQNFYNNNTATRPVTEKFDFSESIISVIAEDVVTYIHVAFALQQKQIDDLLALQNVKITKPTDKGREAETPELIGRGGQGKHVIKDKGKFFAISKMAGVDDFREVVKAFLEDTPSLLEEQLLKLPGKGHDPVVSVSVILILLLLLFKCIKYSKNI